MVIGPAFGQKSLTSLGSEFEVSKRNVKGHRWVAVLTRIDSSAGAGQIEDWRPLGGQSNILSVTSGETWTVESDSPNDTLLGTGAQTIEVLSLDNDGFEQITTANLDGTDPVTLSGSHWRPRSMRVLTSGTSRTNEGNIILRKSGTGDDANVRNYIVQNQSFSKDPHFTVPAGKTAFIRQSVFFVPKNQDAIARNVFANNGINTPINVGLDLPLYQQSFEFPVIAPFILPEKTDIVFQVSTSNPAVELQSIVNFMVVDNEYIGDYL